MSLQSANEFVQAAAKNPALTEESKTATTNKTPEEAAVAISALGKREGYDFTPAEALEYRRNFIRELSDSELDSVAGGAGDPTTASLTAAGSIIGGEVVPGGGIIGAGVGAGIGTAIAGGSTQESVMAGVNASNDSINSAKSVVQQVFSGW
jgi:predicted ribosomally synthesized peptide with nif11-like leader